MGAPKGDFNAHLQSALGEVNELQQKAEQAIQQLAGEGKGDLQETMIAIEKADVSFRLMMQIRNKVLEAYQEIMRMQV
jgi:flagellar hook-basal body complex protein FliE